MPAARYGRTHQQLRAALMAVLKPGSDCRRCRKPMWPGAHALDLGHPTDGFAGMAIEHAKCNRSAGAVAGNRMRGRTCRNPKCRQKFIPTRRRQAYCSGCRQVAGAKPQVVSAGRAW